MSGPRQSDDQGDCLPETSFVMSECFASARMLLQSPVSTKLYLTLTIQQGTSHPCGNCPHLGISVELQY